MNMQKTGIVSHAKKFFKNTEKHCISYILCANNFYTLRMYSLTTLIVREYNFEGCT